MQVEQAPDEFAEGPLQEGNFLMSCAAALLETCYSVDRAAARQALKQQQQQQTAEATAAAARGEVVAAGRQRSKNAADKYEIKKKEKTEIDNQTEDMQQDTAAEAEAAAAAQAAAAAAAAAAEAEVEEAVEARMQALEPKYKAVEAAASRLRDLVAVLFKLQTNEGNLEELLLALSGPDAPLVVEIEDSAMI